MKKILFLLCLILTINQSKVFSDEQLDTITELEKKVMNEIKAGQEKIEKQSNFNVIGDIAVAVLYPTNEKSVLGGNVMLQETDKGLMITATLYNVPDPGKHGFHIHQNGSCEDAGKAAGGHYNPKNVDHGHLEKNGETEAHLGDLGNVVIDENGVGTINTTLPMLNISADNEYNVKGKAIILHAKEDDFGQPTGNAGARIACGIIE